MHSILFVCTGNTCRSPMAMTMFRALLAEKRTDGQDWKIESAGTWAEGGFPATDLARRTMTQRGLSLAGHRSRIVTEEILAGADLVLTLTASHKEALQVEFPALRKRVYMLSEMSGKRIDVPDPIGGTPSDYEETARLIGELLQNGYLKIIKLCGVSG